MTVTVLSMRLKFPEFSDVSDAELQNDIDEAFRGVDADIWLPGDFDLAWMYLAAHYRMVTISRTASASGQLVSSERIGEISITYKTPELPQVESSSDLTTTPYGVRYLEYCHLNFPPVAVI